MLNLWKGPKRIGHKRCVINFVKCPLTQQLTNLSDFRRESGEFLSLFMCLLLLSAVAVAALTYWPHSHNSHIHSAAIFLQRHAQGGKFSRGASEPVLIQIGQQTKKEVDSENLEGHCAIFQGKTATWKISFS